MNEKHGLLLCCGPQNPPWRRILVIGREANSTKQVGDHVDFYQLRDRGRVAFWTWSHKAIERAAALPFSLRKATIAVGSSPIVYADASPRSIRVGVGPTGPPVTSDELRAHALKLSALPEALDCPLVVVSGARPKWAAFYDTALPVFEKAGALVSQAPFFGRGATRETMAAAFEPPSIRLLVHAIVHSWANAHGLLAS